MTSPLLLVVGSLNYDLILRNDRLPRAGETIATAELTESCGGKGANQAVAAARFAARFEDSRPEIVFSGAVGKDLFGKRQIDQLRQDGIDTRFVHELEGISTGMSTIWVETATGQNRILNAPGANRLFLPQSIEELPLDEASLLLIQNEIPPETTRALANRAAELDLPLLWDPAPFPTKDPLPLDPGHVDIVTPNETEAEAILDRPLRPGSLEEEAEAICNLGFGTVVLTLGSKGVVVANRGGRTVRIEAPTVNAVDSTGAGDAFCGALAAALILGFEQEKAIRHGVEYASESVTRHGAQSSFPK